MLDWKIQMLKIIKLTLYIYIFVFAPYVVCFHLIFPFYNCFYPVESYRKAVVDGISIPMGKGRRYDSDRILNTRDYLYIKGFFNEIHIKTIYYDETYSKLDKSTSFIIPYFVNFLFNLFVCWRFTIPKVKRMVIPLLLGSAGRTSRLTTTFRIPK